MTTFRVGSASDPGRVRAQNEDSKLVTDDLYAVADGMGGHQAGDVASALAVRTLEAEVTEPSLDALMEGVRRANRTIFEKAGGDVNLRGMGTTLCAIRLVDTPDGEEVAWVNVGDSRVYLFRAGELTQLSTDHSLVEDLIRDGHLTPEDAKVHPQRNIVTRALGVDIDVQVDGNTVIPVQGDRFLLCSDGLFNEVEESRIAGVLRRLVDPDEAASELVRLANDHGGRDNITIVLADVTEDGGRAEEASAALAAAKSGLTSVTEPVTAEAGEPGDVLPGRRSSLPEAPDDLGSDIDDVYGDLDRARASHVTWRVVAFLVALLLVVGAAGGAIAWQARHTYYVGFADSEVTIFKGRPGGLLWFKPTVQQRTGISESSVPAARRPEIAKGKDAASVAAARRYVVNLKAQIEAQTPTTTSTTTTTVPKKTTATTVPGTTAPPTSASPTTVKPPGSP